MVYQRSVIEDAVYTVFADEIGILHSQVNDDTEIETLNLDSFHYVELAVGIEDELGDPNLALDESELYECKTFGSLIDKILSLLNGETV